MGRIREPLPVLPIVALLARDEAALGLGREAAGRIVGAIGEVSPVWPFEWTRYYEDEMGPALARQIVSAAEVADPGGLAGWKRAAQAEEAAIAGRLGAARPVNIDPGYVAGSKVVLASTKDFAHRVYLSAGIYAEVTLNYARGRFEPLPWTYPDWRSGRYEQFLRAARAHWRARLPAVSASGDGVPSTQVDRDRADSSSPARQP
ncbi:MAG: DUF4416 family protein [Polyangiaceae bacterium]